MTCQELASRIEAIEPHAPPREVARLCLLLANLVEDTDELIDDARLSDAWNEMSMRLRISTDQHAAMTEDLENLAQSDPTRFSPEQIWILIRAIKVQSQVLQLYLGESVLDV